MVKKMARVRALIAENPFEDCVYVFHMIIEIEQVFEVIVTQKLFNFIVRFQKI